MAIDFLGDYLNDPANPLNAYPKALRKKAPKSVDVMTDTYQPGLANSPPEAPASASASIEPGVVASHPDVRYTNMDPEYAQTTDAMKALLEQDYSLQNQGALIDSLRNKRDYHTGWGAALGGAGNIVAAIADQLNENRRADLVKKSSAERDRYRNLVGSEAARQSATGRDLDLYDF